jgi:hypothetical protein
MNCLVWRPYFSPRINRLVRAFTWWIEGYHFLNMYNFIKIHRALRRSPARAAGVTDRLWSVEDLVALWEAYEPRRAERAA